MLKADIGVIGLAVMGQNLALNIARKGFAVAVYNRTSERTKNFIQQRVKDEQILPSYDLKSFVSSLKKPRKIIIMVKAGSPVDDMINDLLPYLEEGDLLIDAGNSHYADTNKRLERLSKSGILFLGTGVSGGEFGALHGPSIMPGGTRQAYELVEEIFLKIAAKTEDGPCCTYVGDYSAGHFVKMVHNGIEYAIMQAIAEVYDIMRKILNLKIAEIGKIFERWNNSELSSFLVEITYKIMEKTDSETGKPMLDMILDKAEQKGTGKWTVEAALDLGIPTPSLNLAVVARVLSHFKDQRVQLSNLYWKKPSSNADSTLIDDLEKALELAMFLAYSQGLWLIHEASKVYRYGADLSEVLRIWKGGCIIRSKMIDFLRNILVENPQDVNLLGNKKAVEYLKQRIHSTMKVCQIAREAELPTLVLNSSLDYLFSMKEANLPANLIQAQRDFFGAHTFERIDKPGIYHIEWQPLE